MALHVRHAPPRLSVRGALMWIALVAVIMALAVGFADHPTPH